MTRSRALFTKDRHIIKLSTHNVRRDDETDIKRAVDELIANHIIFSGTTGDVWVRGRAIGTGAFASVFECANDCASVIKVAEPSSRKALSILKNEEQMFRTIGGGNTRLFPSLRDSGNGFIVIERFDRDASFLPHAERRPVARKIIEALALIHNVFEIAHGDIKPQNILVKNDGSAVLADLGLARSMNRDNECKIVGTCRYMSVGAHQRRPPTRRDDLESFGWTLVTLFGGKLPWKGSSSNLASTERAKISALTDVRSFVNTCLIANERDSEDIAKYIEAVVDGKAPGPDAFAD